MAQASRFGPWIVRGSIQDGRGNADVYQVAHEKSGVEAALKSPRRRGRLDEPYLRFRDEVAFHRKYADPGVLPMLDSYAPESLPPGERAWFVMPLAVPFDRAVADAPLATVVDAVATVAETLARLAALGVHHRDIKPLNLFERDGTHLVGDFGLVTYPAKPEMIGSGRHLGPIYYSLQKWSPTHTPRSASQPTCSLLRRLFGSSQPESGYLSLDR